MRKIDKPKPPTEEEVAHELEWDISHRRRYTGLSQEGVVERAAELAATKPRPRFQEPPK